MPVSYILDVQRKGTQGVKDLSNLVMIIDGGAKVMKLPKNLLINDIRTIHGISCLSLDFNNLPRKEWVKSLTKYKQIPKAPDISVLVSDDYEA